MLDKRIYLREHKRTAEELVKRFEDLVNKTGTIAMAKKASKHEKILTDLLESDHSLDAATDQLRAAKESLSAAVAGLEAKRLQYTSKRKKGKRKSPSRPSVATDRPAWTYRCLY